MENLSDARMRKAGGGGMTMPALRLREILPTTGG